MKIIKVKSCLKCPYVVIYKSTDDWTDVKKWKFYCGQFDVSEISRIYDASVIDDICTLENEAG